MMTNEQHIPVTSAASDEAFQARVQPWMLATFGAEISADTVERNHRFLEESLELVQACGCTVSEAHQLVDYVFGRQVGEQAQEVGGVMVTLAALCLAQGLDMHSAGEAELARIWTKVEAIRAKQAAKPKHSPLPAAAPQVVAEDPPQPIIGLLMDRISALPVLWGLNEPGALLRNSDVFRVLAAAGRDAALASNSSSNNSSNCAAAPVQAQEPVAWAKTPNPFPEGSPNENWRRGYEGVRHFGAPDSQAAMHWKMGRAARKADDAAPVYPVAVPDGDPRPLFDRKLADLEQRGYEVIGRILHKDGQYALFDSSCRWLEKAQYQRLMHEQDGSLFAAPAAQGDSKDAERYRELRACNGGSLVIVHLCGEGNEVVLTEQDADTAIDAAIATKAIA